MAQEPFAIANCPIGAGGIGWQSLRGPRFQLGRDGGVVEAHDIVLPTEPIGRGGKVGPQLARLRRVSVLEMFS